jgi:hypothetical protein
MREALANISMMGGGVLDSAAKPILDNIVRHIERVLYD